MVPVLVGVLFFVASSVETCEHSASFISNYALAADPKSSSDNRRKSYEKTIKACPDDPRLYGQFAALLIADREFDAALSWVDKGLKLSPTSSDLRIQKAAALLALGHPQQVLATLAHVAAGEAHFYLGLAYRQLQNHSQALHSFLDAWELGYKDAYVLYSVVQEDYALGNKRGGLEQFQLLLKIYPDSAWVHLLLADAYFAKEQNERAKEEYAKALAIKPDLLEANFRLGYLDFQSGDRESAAAYFRKEISVNPSYVDAHVFLAETLLQIDQKPEALVELQKALALDPASDLTYKRLATTLIETNQLQEAARILKSAELRFPKDPAFPAQQARVFRMLNLSKEAQSAAERARQLTAEQHRKQELSPAK